MNQLKQIVLKLLPDFVYFFRHLKYKMIILLLSSIFVGLLDGLGLAMFIPLLELVSNPQGAVSYEKLGNLSFLLKGVETAGFSLTLNVVLVIMLLFFIFKGIATFFERYLRVVYQQYFISKLRQKNLNAFANFNYTTFVHANAGIIQNTMSGEVERVLQAFRAYSTILQQLVMIATYGILAFLASPEFAILVIVGGVLSNLIFSQLYRKTKVLSSELVQRNHSFQGYLIQVVTFFKYLKATGTILKYTEFLNKKIVDIEVTNRKMGILSSVMMGIREPLMICIVVAVIFIQVNVLGGGLGLIILSLLFFYRGLTSLTAMQTSYNTFLGYTGSMKNMTDFTNNLQANPTKTGSHRIESFKKSIELREISFSYNNTKPILENISLIIPRNETIAFVGESGSGKTTLMNILAGLITPKSGQLLIDDLPASELDILGFQKRIGYITQDPVIFDDSVFNNVTLWDTYNEENLKRFNDAINKAHIFDYVYEQKLREHAPLGNNGISISGGQKQRVSIARELYKDVDLLFMDEATSALDTETERNIQENMEELKGKYTIIIIAHRMSTIKNVDKILILNQGSITFFGSYENAMRKSEQFKKMISLSAL